MPTWYADYPAKGVCRQGMPTIRLIRGLACRIKWHKPIYIWACAGNPSSLLWSMDSFQDCFRPELARGLHGTCMEGMIKRNEVAKALGNVCRTNTERTGTYAEHTELCTFARGLPGTCGNV